MQYYLFGGASLALSASSGSPWTPVTFSGSIFTGNSTFRVHFASFTIYESIVSSGTVAANGTLAGSFAVPQIPGGTYNVTIETSSNESVYTSFIVNPAVSINANTYHVGDPLTMTGKGFRASATVNIQFDTFTVTSTTSDGNGAFSVTFNVPPIPAGAHSLVVSDGVNSLSATLSVIPSMTLSPTTVHVGNGVTLSGRGFGGGRIVNITFDGISVTSITSSPEGGFTAVFNVPAGRTGTHAITANDGINSQSANLSITQLTAINPTTIHVGDAITVTGTGFGLSRMVNIQFDGIPVISINDSANGSFTAFFSAPPAQTGIHTVTAGDGLVSYSANLSIFPYVKTSTVSAHVGEQVEITGTGFDSVKIIEVKYDNTNVASIPTDTYGSFIGVFKIPASQAGTNLITAGDGQNNLSVNVSVLPLITLGPTSGVPGSVVTASGTGFNANRPVTVLYADTNVVTVPSIITTDNYGSFSGNFSVPWLDVNSYKVSVFNGTDTATAGFDIITSFTIMPNSGNVGSNVTIYGNHNITLNDALSTLQTGFVLESVPPPAPASLSFAKGPKQGPQPTFAWQSVSDPSSVVYSLQIGTNANFTNVILEKQGLSSLQYTLTDLEKLQSTKSNAPYFWRIRAVDMASNEGDWSEPTAFYVSFFPDWAAYTLIALGSAALAVLIFFFGFIMGRRPKIGKTKTKLIV